MTKIRPFRAVVYNQERIAGIDRVVCPPYDVISPAQQENYLRRDPFNFIHIILGKDVGEENKYRRAAAYFKGWIDQGILRRDDEPAFYFYSQKYEVDGSAMLRTGFMGLLKLEDRNCSVYGHEHTRLEAKEDRLRLIKEVKANLSPIFAVFPDKKKFMPAFVRKYVIPRDPDVFFTDDAGVEHKMWRVTDPGLVKMVQEALSGECIFIADGHHRYEVSCVYRRQMKEKAGGKKGEQSRDYTLAYFTGADPRGLSILPIHRLVKTSLPQGEKKFLEQLKEHFEVSAPMGKAGLFAALRSASSCTHVIGMYISGKYRLLRLKDKKALDKLMPDKPREYRLLDVSILNQLVFLGILGLRPESKDALKYSEDREETVKAVDAGEGRMAFFLRPVTMEQIISVALKGEKMPAKSTFFYPKLISGLVVHKH
ncbi:MAG: DUF1015 domain-containing protein [Candidatus Omnitrophica bacterium]|jgi:uncharacterized protein (DUF1015 family)|nr:DUF1015 domain-containing protein [Candidatus Omnitrophota bacterium]